MRVGHLAKGLLLKGDNSVELVVLCADKPTLTLLKKVVELLPVALKQVRAVLNTARTYKLTERRVAGSSRCNLSGVDQSGRSRSHCTG